MSFLDKLGEMLGAAGDTANDVMSRVRYGVDPNEKYRMALTGELPGAPSFSNDPAAAERYASTYLGTKKWGRLPAELFNTIALSDIVPAISGQPEQATRVKAAGRRGIDAGAMAAQVEEARRRQRLASLFGDNQGG